MTRFQDEFGLPALPGIFIQPGQPYEVGTLAKWLAAWGLDGVPADQELPSPVGLRIHDLERDFPTALDAIAEALELGFTPHLNFVEGWTQAYARWDDLSGVIVSIGNSTTPGDGFEDAFTLDTYPHQWDTEVQDDAGVRGAVINAERMRDWSDEDRRLSFHVYGDAGGDWTHLRTLRKWNPKRPMTLMELHWGFRGHGNSRADAPEIYSAEAGAYVRRMVQEAGELGMDCCLFTGRDFLEPDGLPAPSLLALQGKLDAKPFRASWLKRTRYSLGMHWQRGKA